MAEDCKVGASSSKEKTESGKEYDPALDFYSENFDPIKALYTPGLRPPVVTAKTYDNVAKYESVSKQLSADRKSRVQKPKAVPSSEAATNQRKWLPHQLPIQTEKLTRKKNIFEKMNNIQGPLKLLKDCRENRLRIKVFTRHSHGIRGYCIGYITMFDKHFNMTLEDVYEEWTRPKRRKIPALSDNFAKLSISSRIEVPKIVVIRADKKTETCQRRMNQVLLRGEHVAYVVVLRDLDK